MTNYFITAPTTGASGFNQAATKVYEMGRKYDGYLLSRDDLDRLAAMMSQTATDGSAKLRKPLSVRLSEGYGGLIYITLYAGSESIWNLICDPIKGVGINN